MTNIQAIRNARATSVALLADDDLFIRTLLKKILPQDCTLVETSDGADVVDAYKEHVPDIVFLDLHMPNKEGLKILQEIIALDSSAYVVIITADNTRDNVAASVIAGAKQFMAKPLDGKRIIQEYNSAISSFKNSK